MIAKQPVDQGRLVNDETCGLCPGARTRAFDVHEIRVWRLNKSLELVPALFSLERWVEEVNGERL